MSNGKAKIVYEIDKDIFDGLVNRISLLEQRLVSVVDQVDDKLINREGLLNESDLANLLGKKLETIQRKRREGRITPYKYFDNTPMYRLSDILKNRG